MKTKKILLVIAVIFFTLICSISMAAQETQPPASSIGFFQSFIVLWLGLTFLLIIEMTIMLRRINKTLKNIEMTLQSKPKTPST